ncbi:MAG: small subunit ribosomal protein S3 [Colwellia polaris]|jgi:small subunit ribosomal protein S3
MQEKEFIQQGARKVRLHEFLEEELEGAGYSKSELVRTPTSTKIVVHAQRPGLVIGRGGSRIKELTTDLEEEFDFENPQIEVNEIENADSDAEIVAKSIASWLEKGGHAKRVGYTYIRRMKEAGVIGAEIEITGKLSGNRGRTEKFSFGYVKRCGNTSKDNVEKAYQLARTKPGAIGVKVRIMKELPEFMHRNVDVNEEILHQAEGAEADEAEKPEIIDQIIKEAEDMTSAELERAIEELPEEVETGGISKDEVREAFENQPDELDEEIEEEVEEAVEEAEEELEEEVEEVEEQLEKAEEELEDLDTEEVVSSTVKEAKEQVREIEEDLEELPVEELIEAEEEGKGRKTLLEWLRNRK